MWRIRQRLKKGTGRPGATEDLESSAVPTEFPTANQIPQTDAEVQGNLLREYQHKFVDLPEQAKLTELCSNAGFSKNTEKGQFSISLDDDTLDKSMGSCREYPLPRSDESSQVKRVDPWKHEDRSSPVSEGLLSSRTLRCGDQDRILIS